MLEKLIFYLTFQRPNLIWNISNEKFFINNQMQRKPFSPNIINLSNLVYEEKKGITDHYKCVICIELALDPLFCSKCNAVYCRRCLNDYSSHNQKPHCIYKCGSSEFIGPTNKEREILDLIRLKCVYKGCDTFINFLGFNEHLKKCSFRKYHCNNNPCEQEGLLHEMEDHVNKCIYREIVCQFCKNKIIFNNKENHLNQECPEYNVKCIECGLTIKKEDYEKHQSDKETCLKRKKIFLENKVKELENDSLNINNQINMLKTCIKDCEKELNEMSK